MLFKFWIHKFQNNIYSEFYLCFWVKFFDGIIFKQSYIVYLGEHSHGVGVASVDLQSVENSHHEFLGSFLGRYFLV